MPNRSVFAQRLRSLREAHGLNYTQLAEKLGVSGASLGYYENEKRVPDIETVQKMCEVFEVSADYLLGLSDAKSLDIDIQAICKKIGCSQLAIEQYKLMLKQNKGGKLITSLLENPLYAHDIEVFLIKGKEILKKSERHLIESIDEDKAKIKELEDKGYAVLDFVGILDYYSWEAEEQFRNFANFFVSGYNCYEDKEERYYLKEETPNGKRN